MKRLTFVFVVLFSLLLTLPTSATPNRPYICHAEGMYNKDTWNKAFPVDEGQMFGHIGHQNAEDIIPPFEYNGNTYSQNWFEPFITIYNNECAVADPTSTPTETMTSTPTEVVTETPTETATATATPSVTSTATETRNTPTVVVTSSNTPSVTATASSVPTAAKTPIIVTTLPDTGSGPTDVTLAFYRTHWKRFVILDLLSWIGMYYLGRRIWTKFRN